MSLLTVENRKKFFKYLGLTYNKSGIEKFQRMAFTRKKDIDSVYGVDTDRALRHFINVKRYTKNFKPEEFRCNCGHCTGYPSWMKKVELQNLQKIRDHYGKPMKVTSGLRCKWDNDRSTGSIKNSKHLTGYACDFYMEGVTDTLAHRKSAINYIKKLPNHNYTYGDGINSNGVKVSAPYMYNALHTDTNKPKAAPKEKTRMERAVDYGKGMAKDDSIIYVKWDGNDIRTQLCYVCHHYKGKLRGTNCIKLPFICWVHGGGVKCKHEGGLIHNSLGNRMYLATVKEATKMAQKALGCKDIIVIRNKSGISKKLIKPGDACMIFNGKTYVHMTMAADYGMMVHAQGSNGKVPKDKQVEYRKAYTPKMLIRYVGK